MSPESPLEPLVYPVEGRPRYPFWGYGDLFLFFALGVPCLLAGQLIVKAITYLLGLHVSAQGLVLVPAEFIGYGFLFLSLFAIFKTHYRRPFWEAMRFTRYKLGFGPTILLGFALAFSLSLAGYLMRIPDLNTPMKELLADKRSAILIAFFAVTLGPLCEELAFRGFMQPLLVRSFGAAAGILLTALPFGLLHLAQYAFSWRHVLLITAAGAAFGCVRHFTGSTLAATVMHAAYNSTLFLAFFGPGKSGF